MYSSKSIVFFYWSYSHSHLHVRLNKLQMIFSVCDGSLLCNDGMCLMPHIIIAMWSGRLNSKDQFVNAYESGIFLLHQRLQTKMPFDPIRLTRSHSEQRHVWHMAAILVVYENAQTVLPKGRLWLAGLRPGRWKSFWTGRGPDSYARANKTWPWIFVCFPV